MGNSIQSNKKQVDTHLDRLFLESAMLTSRMINQLKYDINQQDSKLNVIIKRQKSIFRQNSMYNK